MRAALFIDKDGTLIENMPYNLDVGLMRFTQEALPALRRFQDAGFALVVISNQPGIGEGRFGMREFAHAQAGLIARLRDEGIHLAGFFACPHVPGSGCGCRKPEAGLLRLAASMYGLDLSRSWMVGDILDDVEAGHRAGCRSVLLDVGNETQWLDGLLRRPEHRCASLWDVAEAILGHQAQAHAPRPEMAA